MPRERSFEEFEHLVEVLLAPGEGFLLADLFVRYSARCAARCSGSSAPLRLLAPGRLTGGRAWAAACDC